MLRITKKTVSRAIVRAADMLERNANPCDTFEGVLARRDTYALRTLIALGQRFLARPKPASRTMRPATRSRVRA